MKKRLLSILLMCCMVLTLLPTTAFAEESTETPPVCSCETACTAESMNAACPVCGAEGALPENCGKYAAEKSGQTGAPDNAPVITAADVQALIDALPEAETISEDNAADVEAQLEAIDEAKVQLSDEDFAVLDFTRYDAAVAALMALSGEPDTAFAPQTANDHTHCYCGGSITAGDHASHSDVTYTAWDGTSSITYTNNTAYVYLTENATLSGHLTVDGKTLYLCLNGKTLASNGTAKIQVKNGGRLVLCDCRGGGTFKGATQSVWGGACIYLYTSTLDMFGGKLTGGKVTGKGGGGAIALDDQQCIFNMYGGEISGNNGKNYGGAIFRKFNANMPNTTGGTFNMYGGTIKDNTAKNGGAFFSTTGGTINMTGGTISGNKATQSSNDAGGGAIYMRGSGTINISGSAQITDNSSSLDGGAILMGWGTINISDSAKINSNTANRWGGAICLRQDSNQSTTLNMRGGEISGNRATKEGGAVHVLDKQCQFYLYDGKITGNTSGDGGAIYLNQEPSWLIMQGGEISGNTATGNGGGVYIYRTGSVCQLYGGKIENNKASGNGGGIYINPSNSGQLRVGNKPLVQNNTVSGKANNVYLPSGKALTIEIGMSKGASIGVTTANTSYPVAFSNDYKNNYANYFFADDANAHVEYQDDRKLYLVSGAVARPLTVTFDPNGGTLAEADKTKSLTTGDTYGTLPVPNYAGYDFAGWYTEQNGGTKIESDTTVTVFGTQTLYAHWTEHEYTVTVVKIGKSEWGSVTPMSTKAKAGETVTLTATPTTGNQFLEWVFLNKPEGGGWVNPVLTFTMPAEDLTIQAKFTVKNYTISYTLEGVSGGSARIVVWGDKVFKYLPQNPTYRDWVFTGWKYGDVTVTEDMTYGDLAGSDTVSSIHIIAQWHQHEFNTWTNGYPGTLKTPADCTHDAVYYWRCVCGEIEYNDKHLYEEPGTALGHLWSWTSNGDGTHTRTCRRENCNATETDNCSGGTATCTAKAKCSTCNAEYGEKLPHDFTAETAEEQYLKSGSSCTEKAVYYKSCTVCGLSSKGTASEATFESGSVLGHEWGAWTSNGNVTHTRVCSRDTSHTETENCHGGTADCTHKAACTVCGGEYGEMAAHSFTAEKAETQYLKSAATCTEKAVYYKSCAVCGTSSKGTADEATFTSGKPLGHDWGAWMPDGEGTHKRVCTHDASHVETAGCTYGDWSTNQDSHWKTCTVCGGEAERLNHADPDCNHFCDTCGIKMTEHDFTGEIAITALLYKEANCLSPALYYKSCKICMLSSKGTADEATFAAGETNPDRHAEEPGDWQLDGNSHWRFYTCCHLEVDRGAHQGGTADCLAPALCEVCQHSYGELGPHHFVDQVNEYRLKSAATCTSPAVYYQSCSTCGAQGTETFTNGEPLGHDYGAWTSNGDGTHTRVCAHDAAHTETENCHGGTATCTAKAVCEVCKAEYGEKLPHDFTAETVDAKYLKSAATCTEKAVYYKSCAACGLSSAGTASEATFEAGNVLGHDWGAWTSNGNDTHTRVCSRDASHTETDKCHGGEASCTMKAVCEVCKAEYGEKDPEHHAEGCELEWVVTETEHEQKYSLCGKVTIAKEKHTFGDWTIIKRPTSNRDGEKERICQICQHKEAKTIPATGSNYSYYTIKATAGAGGSISPSGNVSVREGRDQTFTITPDKGYAVANVKIDGKSIGAVKSYTFEKVSRTHTIEVIFMKANGNPQTGVFVDVATGSYYEDAVDWAVETGITKGTDDTHFSPDGICTRAQAVTFLWRTAGSPASKTSAMPFTDVPVGSYYYDAVLWAVENGITKGTSDTTFSPNMTCTRAQIVAFLWRSEKSPAAGTANPFADVKSTAYYADAVLWAVKENITKGTTNTTFSPDADCTRAQIVTFLWRCKK